MLLLLLLLLSIILGCSADPPFVFSSLQALRMFWSERQENADWAISWCPWDWETDPPKVGSTSYTWSSNIYMIWPYKWVTGVISQLQPYLWLVGAPFAVFFFEVFVTPLRWQTNSWDLEVVGRFYECRLVWTLFPGTLNNQLLMDVWWNNNFLCNDLESSNWNNHI